MVKAIHLDGSVEALVRESEGLQGGRLEDVLKMGEDCEKLSQEAIGINMVLSMC
jgi:hypothetical protein